MSTTAELESEADERDPVQEMRERMLAAGITPERTQAETAAFRELQQKYPRMYAVIQEKRDGEKLVEPYLLAVSASEAEMIAFFRALPTDSRNEVAVRYVRPAGQAMGY